MFLNKAKILSVKLLILCSLLNHSTVVWATVGDKPSSPSAQQREAFERLELLVSKPNSTEYKKLREQIRGYPLEPYIEQLTLRAFPYNGNQQKITEFLRLYEGTPLDWPLRRTWLEQLAKNNDAERFIQFFKPTANVELTCQFLSFKLLRKDDIQSVYNQAEKLWVVGESQPNECDPVFKAWTQAGLRTEKHVLARLALAADGGNHTLIPYLKTLLSEDKQYLADLWLSVRRNPGYVSRLSKFPGTHKELELAILQYGLTRLIWRDDDLALKSWQKVLAKYNVQPTSQLKMAETFAIALTINEHPKASEWLEKASHENAEEQLFRWHLAYVIKSGNWQHALEVIDLLPSQIAQDLSFQYWQARAFEQINESNKANLHYQQIAKNRHYYGFLASGKLALTPNMVDKPLEFDPMTLSQVANMPAAKRAHEFLQLQRYTEARREWWYLQSQLSPQQELVSAVLADSWQWHDRAITGFSNTGYLDDIKRRFPMAYKDQLLNHAQVNQIDPAWAFAIARRESSFMSDANSSAGAKGLMQLLPGTARYLAKKKVSNQVLFDPDSNAGYGTQYLRYLMDKMDDNPVLATASYNAGWRRVQSWVPRKQSMPVDIWIETIPYKETRNYVKAVLAYRQIYAQQLGQSTGLFEDLVNMKLGGVVIEPPATRN
ncbi:lytic transglycosylase domain-containing protein [Aliiglaciecola sp. LCG003]|uniref:lytic transglycosylase domain-containing protein n=1 Tax=Aliiglaciecola sp. LCG003 TaxID=3053655 RepID=UPI002573EDB9|nr:lytic transglycosylase domain-containing protein [Aliiglaciecola sp. LCG003]WJG09060.1 transglycosylase SLT domain-containing protein [Aliiglaciecola sp. LCG003]